jgi:hypothetical protein
MMMQGMTRKKVKQALKKTWEALAATEKDVSGMKIEKARYFGLPKRQ